MGYFDPSYLWLTAMMQGGVPTIDPQLPSTIATNAPHPFTTEPSVTEPSVPIQQPIEQPETVSGVSSSDGGGGVSGFVSRDTDYKAYDPEFWGGSVPSGLFSGNGLLNGTRQGLQSAQTVAKGGIRAGMLAPLAGSPLGILRAIGGLLGASPSSGLNPVNDPTVRTGLNTLHTTAPKEIKAAIGTTTEQFGDFLNNMFGQGTSFMDIPDVFGSGLSNKSFSVNDTTKQQLSSLLGVTPNDITPDIVYNMRVNSLDNVQGLGAMMQPNNFDAYSELKNINAQFSTNSIYMQNRGSVLTPSDFGYAIDTANKAQNLGVNLTPGAVGYQLALNPGMKPVISNMISRGDTKGLSGIQATRNDAVARDMTRGLLGDYMDGKFDGSAASQAEFQSRLDSIHDVRNGSTTSRSGEGGWDSPGGWGGSGDYGRGNTEREGSRDKDGNATGYGR